MQQHLVKISIFSDPDRFVTLFIQELRNLKNVNFQSHIKIDTTYCYINYSFYRRMPKCNTVLQSENDLFEPEIQPNSHEIC